MTPKLTVALKCLVLIVTIVAGAGPAVAQLGGIVPPQWLTIALQVVAACGAIHLLLQESPLIAPLLPAKASIDVIDAAVDQAVKTLPKPPRLPPLPCLLFVLTLVGCKSFGADVQAATPAIGPVLACIVGAVDVAADPNLIDIESTVASCGVAAADVDQVVSSIEALASAPSSAALLKPGLSVKIRAMRHRTSAMIDARGWL